MSKKGGDAPQIDPRYYDDLDKQVAQGDQMVQFLKDSYNQNSARQDKQDTLNQQVIGQQMRLAQSNEDRSNDQYNFYKTNGQPVVQQALKDSQDYDSADNIQAARSRATADAQSGFDNAQGQNNRMLERMGVNPNSAKFQALNNSLQLQKAAGLAGAGNSAEEARRSGAIQLRQQAGNLASGMPAQSMGFSGQAGAMGSSASGIGQGGINARLSQQGALSSGMNNAAGIYGSAANSLNSLYSNQISGYSAQNQAEQSSMGGMGQLAGMGMAAMAMADGGNVSGTSGGKISGPGTGISDSVHALNGTTGQPIMLSNGEYVIPADVVRKVGESHFDQLLHKYHTPAAQQRKGNIGRAA